MKEQNSRHYAFYQNTQCEYFPCHKTAHPEDFNCLFCYCPFYLREKCPGAPKFLDIRGRIVKDCSGCVFPHCPENYDVIIEWIRKENEQREFSEEIRRKAVKVETKDKGKQPHEN